jgi:hypothetical protein
MARKPNTNIVQIMDNAVKTPWGVNGNLIGMAAGKTGYLIRIVINDITQPHLADDNCLTKYAKVAGIWEFAITDIQALNPCLKE